MQSRERERAGVVDNPFICSSHIKGLVVVAGRWWYKPLLGPWEEPCGFPCKLTSRTTSVLSCILILV